MGEKDLTYVAIYSNKCWSRSPMFGENLYALLLQEGFFHEVENKGRIRRTIPVLGVKNLVSKYLHWKLDLVGQIWSDCLSGEDINP